MPDPESVSLPEPPPPRPAARDAAVDAALRRFDRVEEPVREPSRPTPWSRRSEFQLAIAASLALVIAIPVALIGLPDQAPGPIVTQPSSPQTPDLADRSSKETAVEPGQAGQHPAERAPFASPQAPASDVAVVAPIASANEMNDAPPPAPAPARERDEAYYAAPPPPAPPPPPPPAPPALAQKSAEARAGDVVVTGTRIPRPNLVSSSPMTVVEGQSDEREFLGQLQAAIRGDDREAVLNLIRYPLRVNSGGRSKMYRNSGSVERDFDRIFTARVRQAILAQRPDQIFSRDIGSMIGNGEVWFNRVCSNSDCSSQGPVRITVVNP